METIPINFNLRGEYDLKLFLRTYVKDREWLENWSAWKNEALDRAIEHGQYELGSFYSKDGNPHIWECPNGFFVYEEKQSDK